MGLDCVTGNAYGAAPMTTDSWELWPLCKDEVIARSWGTVESPGPLWAVPGGRYPAGEPRVAPCKIPRDILLRPRTVETLMTVLWWVDALRERRYRLGTLYLPCVPGARQDRLTPQGDQLFTLKSVAREINLRRFDRVVVLDPHSEVTPALIERCEVVTAKGICGQWATHPHWDGVIAPDGGAVKRAAGVADLLQVPLYHGWKCRDVKTGTLSGFGIQPLSMPDRSTTRPRYLMVDDLCDGGGTFIGLAQSIRAQLHPIVPRLDLYVTHGFFTKGTCELRREFDRIITTDSVVSEKDGVEVIEVCRRLICGS